MEWNGAGLADAVTVAMAHGASEVWIFGSAAHAATRHYANDLDVAVLGLDQFRVVDLRSELKKRFPTSRIESATAYTTPRQDSARGHFHFLLSTTPEEGEEHPIYDSIMSGRRIG